MKIGILIDNLQAGASQRQALDWAIGLQQLGHEVTLLGLRAGIIIRELANARKIPCAALQTLDLGIDHWGIVALRQWVRTQMPQKLFLCGANVTRYAAQFQKEFNPVQVTVLLNTIEVLAKIARAAQGAARITCATAKQKASLEAQGVSANKVCLIDTPVFSPQIAERSRDKMRAYYGAKASTCVIISPLNPSRSSLKSDAVKLFKDFKKQSNADWQLWLMGGGRGFVTAEWLAHCFGISNQVKFIGESVEAMEPLKAADLALCMQSSYEADFFKAQACMAGLPLLSQQNAEFYSAVIPAEFTGLLSTLSTGSLTSLLKDYVVSAQKREILGQIGANWAIMHLDCKAKAAQLLAFCDGTC